jgi:DNA-binding MarR family transcriptional regulator
MGLETDIQQQKFRNNHQKAMVNVIFTANWLLERIKLFLKDADITTQQYNMLRILRGSKKPLSTLQIRERMLDRMSDTSRIVDRLVKKNLVEKQVCLADKRLVDVQITEKGLLMLDQLDQKNMDLDGILKNLTASDSIHLNALLDKMRE